jgi:hypothetical protein
MCDCKERIRKEILEHNLYPGAERISDLNIEMLSGHSFSQMEAIFPTELGKKNKPKEFSMFHTFCPWCGEPYKKNEPEYKALTEAMVKVPVEMLKQFRKVPVVLCEWDTTQDTLYSYDVMLDCVEPADEEDFRSTECFIFIKGDESAPLATSAYDGNYYCTMPRPEFIKQMNLQKERKMHG